MNRKPLTESQALKLLNYLFDYQMTNYGYYAKDWSRIIAQRQRAKAQVSRLLLKDKAELMENINKEYLSNDRLQANDKGQFVYVVGQSANEEITNIIRRIADPRAKWLS